jgi:hypothetical protein
MKQVVFLILLRSIFPLTELPLLLSIGSPNFNSQPTMRPVILFLSLILTHSPIVVGAQSQGFSTIQNFFYQLTTMGFDKNPVAQSHLKKQFGSATYQYINHYSKEQNWPPGMQTDAARTKNWQQLTSFKARYIADMPGNGVLLWITSTDNQHMAADLRPVNDFFLHFDKKGVKLGALSVYRWPASPGTHPVSTRLQQLLEPAKSTTKIISPKRLYFQPLSTVPGSGQKLREQFSSLQAADIEKFSDPDQWNSGLQLIAAGADSDEPLRRLSAYYIADLPQNLVVLWIPLGENKHLPSTLLMPRDFYLIANRDAVTLGKKTRPGGPGIQLIQSKEPIYGFSNQFPLIVCDFGNNYANLKGYFKRYSALSEFYYSRLDLEGAEETTVFVSGRTPGFLASYGQFPDKASARRKFEELVERINNAKIPCCTLVEMDLFESRNLISQSWIPFGKAAGNPFARLLIETEMVSIPNLTGKFNGSNDIWQLVVRIKAR